MAARILATVAGGTDDLALHVMEKLWLSSGEPDTSADKKLRDELADLYSAGAQRGEPLAFFAEPPLPQSYFDAFTAIDRDPNIELIVAELAAGGQAAGGRVEAAGCTESAG